MTKRPGRRGSNFTALVYQRRPKARRRGFEPVERARQQNSGTFGVVAARRQPGGVDFRGRGEGAVAGRLRAGDSLGIEAGRIDGPSGRDVKIAKVVVGGGKAGLIAEAPRQIAAP